MKTIQCKYFLLFLLSMIISSCAPKETGIVETISETKEAAMTVSEEAYWPTYSWRVSTPYEQGMDETFLQQMFMDIDSVNLNIDSVVVVRNGYIVAEKYYPPYEQDTLHEMYSITKSVISALVGIAIQKGYINSIEDPVLDYFPDRSFENDDPLKRSITLEHLLTMSSGLAWDYQEMISSRDWIQYTLDQPMATKPGTEFHYNSGNSHVLSAIIQRTSGMSAREFAQDYLFDPLGISKLRWQKDVDGIYKGGSAIAIPTDVSNQQNCQALIDQTIQHIGRIDMLVNNAGFSAIGEFAELPNMDIFRQVMDVNFTGLVLCTYYALPYLKDACGRVVNVSSLGGKFAIPYNTSYIASKHAVAGFSDSLRMELSKSGVSVSVIFPYWVVTEFHERLLDKDGKPRGIEGRTMYTDKIMTDEECAKIIIKAAKQRKREILMWPGPISNWMKVIAPNLLDKVVMDKVFRPIVGRANQGK